MELVFKGCELRADRCSTRLLTLFSSFLCLLIIFSSPFPRLHFHLSLSFLLHKFMCVFIHVYIEDARTQELIIINSLNILWGFTHLVSLSSPSGTRSRNSFRSTRSDHSTC